MARVGESAISVAAADTVPVREAQRLLFVVNDTAFFVSHRLALAEAAKKRGFSVHLAAPSGEGLDEIRNAGVVHHELRLSRSGRNPLAEARTFAALALIFRRVRPAIVHNVTIKPVLYGSFAARITSVRVVVNSVSGRGHVFLARGIRAAIQRVVVRGLYRFALSGRNTRVVFQNPNDLSEFVAHASVPRDRTILIDGGSGVNLDAYRVQPEPGGPTMVVLAARMLADKGVREFVAAAEMLRRRHSTARFVLVGPLDPSNPSAIAERELADWTRRGAVEWWGQRSDIAAIFAASHIVCLPSYMEGMPKVLLEAAACGRPVVTSDVPGCRDAIVPGETGLLAPARDSAALAVAIESLLTDPVARARLGSNGRRLAERRFGIGAVVNRTLALYDELLAIDSLP